MLCFYLCVISFSIQWEHAKFPLFQRELWTAGALFFHRLLSCCSRHAVTANLEFRSTGLSSKHDMNTSRSSLDSLFSFKLPTFYFYSFHSAHLAVYVACAFCWLKNQQSKSFSWTFSMVTSISFLLWSWKESENTRHWTNGGRTGDAFIKYRDASEPQKQKRISNNTGDVIPFIKHSPLAFAQTFDKVFNHSGLQLKYLPAAFSANNSRCRRMHFRIMEKMLHI